MASVHKIEYLESGVVKYHTLDCIIGSGLSISGSLENDEVYYKEELGQKLKIGNKDYPLLKGMFDNNDFGKITYIVESCGVEIFRGVFTVLNGSFCEDNCTAEFNITKNDAYDCLEKGDKDINFFQLPLNIETTCAENVIELEFRFDAVLPNTCQFSPAFSSSHWASFGVNPIPDPSSTFGACLPESYRILVRQVKNTACIAGNPVPPVGSGWYLVSNSCSTTGYANWARPYTITPAFDPLDFERPFGSPSGCFGSLYIKTDMNGVELCGNWDKYLTPSTTCYDRNRRLDDTLLELATTACPSITCFNSDFLNLATNYVTGQPNRLNDLLIAEKSDMADPTSTNPATKEQINFFDLYENIKEMFDVRFFIDNTGCLNIEHISTYFNNQIDLRPYEISCFCCWEIDNDDIPVREKFEFHESEGLDFKGVPIEYDSIIATGDEEKRDADLITTDIEFIQTTLKSEQSLDGFVITTNELDGLGGFNVKNEVGELSGNNLINGHLSWANLHKNYHKDWKYLPNGDLNNNQITFNSTRPIRKNKTNIYKMTPTEFNSFRDNITGSSVITSCGVGIVDSYKYEYKHNLLRIEATLF